MVVLNCLSLGSWKFFCSSHYNATISQLRDMEMVFSLYWVNLLSCCFLNIILWNQGVAGKALPWEASIPHVCLFVPWWRSPPSPVLCHDLGEQQKIAHVFGFLEPLWSKNKTKQTKKSISGHKQRDSEIPTAMPSDVCSLDVLNKGRPQDLSGMSTMLWVLYVG